MKRQSDSPANAVSGWYPRNRGRQFGSCETGRGVVARGDGCGGAAATRNTRLQYVLYEDGGVHCGVAEEEEHRDQRGDGVDVAEHDAAKGDHECGDERAPRLAAALEELEGGHQVVVGDRLQQPRRARQRLQASAERGEDDADADEPIVERDRRRQERVRLQGVTLGDGAEEQGADEVERRGDEHGGDRAARDRRLRVGEVARAIRPRHDPRHRREEERERLGEGKGRKRLLGESRSRAIGHEQGEAFDIRLEGRQPVLREIPVRVQSELLGRRVWPGGVSAEDEEGWPAPGGAARASASSGLSPRVKMPIRMKKTERSTGMRKKGEISDTYLRPRPREGRRWRISLRRSGDGARAHRGQCGGGALGQSGPAA